MKLLVLLLLAGCASTVAYSRAPVACQEQAMDLVWRGCYGRADHPPEVWWVPPAALDCTFPDGVKGYRLGAGCVAGNTLSATAVNLVDYHRGWQGTDLAHELAHAARLRDGLDPDAEHKTAVFQPRGAVDQCNTRLAAMRCQ